MIRSGHAASAPGSASRLPRVSVRLPLRLLWRHPTQLHPAPQPHPQCLSTQHEASWPFHTQPEGSISALVWIVDMSQVGSRPKDVIGLSFIDSCRRWTCWARSTSLRGFSQTSQAWCRHSSKRIWTRIWRRAHLWRSCRSSVVTCR